MRPHQRDRILAFVEAYYEQNSCAPSLRHVAAQLGLHSAAGVGKQLEKLVEEGRLAHIGGKYVPASAARAASTVMVPLLGQIAAGIPIEAIEQLEGYVAFLPRRGERGEKLFALRIKGESMIEAGIFDGDIVVVEQTPAAENGQIVAALIDGEATVKTFYREHGRYRLQPENSSMKPILVDQVEILGRVVSSMRYY